MSQIYSAAALSPMIGVVHVDRSGNPKVFNVNRLTIMRRYNLPPSDVKLLDWMLDYPSTILGRERAIVVSLDQIRCIITSDEVLLLNSLASNVLEYVNNLPRKLQGGGADDDNTPFEFRALEVALETECTSLNSQAVELEKEMQPLLDELDRSKISPLNLEILRRLKSRLDALTRRVQKVRDAIEQPMDDEGKMAEMYLTEKKRRMELAAGDQSTSHVPFKVDKSTAESWPPDSLRHEGIGGNENDATYSIEELAIMLFAAYFVVIDDALNKLTSMKGYIGATEDFVNIQLDNVRNQLIKVDLLLSTASFVLSIFGVVVGIFGMNLKISLYESRGAFKWVLTITGACGALVFALFLCYFKYRRLLMAA